MKAVILALALLQGTVAAAATTKITSGTVDWSAESTLGVVKIKGTGGKPSGSVEVDAAGMASGEIVCDLKPMTTDNETRDGHMHEKYLKTAQFPTAKLVLDPVKATETDFAFSGKLTIAGETKPVKGTARFKGGALWAEFTVVLTDYPAVGVPEWKGVTVAKDVKVTVQAKTGG